MTIKVFITGGTIDNLEYSSEDKAPKNRKSVIPDLLKRSRIKISYNAEELVLKDSKFITNKDRGLLFQRCKECKEGKIVGNYTKWNEKGEKIKSIEIAES